MDILEDTEIDNQHLSNFIRDSLEHGKHTIRIRDGSLLVIFEVWRKKRYSDKSEKCRREGDTVIVYPT